ncbi:MAG TPA: protein YgfX [Aromatoleum sp.]|uniref:protein YgfX n=1 Tax=Aromatoleum sp. TaxID=2307007 RepID=UPI002B4A5196|nr:protein YgfX [Aromatoleum sp.]HJV26121.1 protein YgfX [Aromatoleum sp.]
MMLRERRSVRFPYEIRLKPSRLSLGLSAAIHMIAAFAFLRSSFPSFAVVVVVVIAALSQRFVMAAERRKQGMALTLQPDGSLKLTVPGGELHALPQAASTDFGWGLWLHWEGSQHRAARQQVLRGAMMLMPDGVDADAWRELRIWFRHVAKPALSAKAEVAKEEEERG